ncbi:MAG TPA: cation:proton antiporter [Chitinophagales bacterium]|nr:cation:proton antiporter [Chitinophagales bacterium]
MGKLATNEVLQFLVIVAILLGTARVMGELFKKFGLPAIIGELLGGILLGPSFIGSLFPGFFQTIFTDPKQPAVAFDGLSKLSVMLLLFIAGMEVKLENIRTRGKAAAKISFSGIIFPLALGFGVTWFFYDLFFSAPAENRMVPALFMGTALSITALGVMAKILIDIDMIKTRFGNLMMTAAMIDDIIGWMLFSVVIAIANLKSESQFNAVTVLLIMIGFAVFLMTVGRKIVDPLFRYANTKLSKPGGELSLAIFLCLLGGIFTEWLGIKAIFGAFLMGITIGNSPYFSEKAKETLHDIVTYVFSPLFFVSIGLKVNFVSNFDLGIVFFVLAISILGKVLGGFTGARLSGFKTNKAMAVGFGMNARGSQEIVLGLVALQAKIIDEKIFVGLVIMTFVTILMAGPMIKYYLRKHESIHPTPEEEKPVVTPAVA